MAKGFTFDHARCVGCKACEMACKNRFALPVGDRRRRVHYVQGGTWPQPTVVFLSMACNHCSEPACVAACPAGAMVRDETDGVVKHDKTKCVGCRRCEWACPYGAVTFNTETKKVDKCEACFDRTGGPACVATCPGDALTWGEVSPAAEPPGIKLPPSAMTKPNFRFE